MIIVITSFSTRGLSLLHHFDFDLKLIIVVIQHDPWSLIMILVAEVLNDLWCSCYAES